MITNRSFIDSTPSPRSLLSSKISEFLRSPSVQPHSASTYPSLYSPVSYRSYSTEPTLYEPLRFRGSSVYPSRGTFSSMRYGSMPRYWDEGDEGEGGEEEDRASRIYKKYHISRAPKAIGYTSHYDEDDTSSYGRQTRVPVSTYRSQLGDGQSHQVDVFPLVESEETVPSRVSLSAHTGTDGPAKKLTVLDKINIKAAIIGSRMESEDGERRYRRPRTMYAAKKHRELLMGDIERKY